MNVSTSSSIPVDDDKMPPGLGQVSNNNNKLAERDVIALLHISSDSSDGPLCVGDSSHLLRLGVSVDFARCQHPDCGTVVNSLRGASFCEEHIRLIARFQAPSVPGMAFQGRSTVRRITKGGKPQSRGTGS